MNIYEDEQYEIKMNRITDRMGYLILDLIAMAIEKIDHDSDMIILDKGIHRIPVHEMSPHLGRIGIVAAKGHV